MNLILMIRLYNGYRLVKIVGHFFVNSNPNSVQWVVIAMPDISYTEEIVGSMSVSCDIYASKHL